MDLAVTIENYEGPLDLLIHLVHKNEMNIFDVPISDITNHFIAEIRYMKELDMEIAAEFIHMASYLIYLKSRSLLPRDDATAGDEMFIEESFNFAHLLIELSYCKELALLLREQAEASGKYLYRRQSILLPKEEKVSEDAYRLADAFFTASEIKSENKVIVHSLKEHADAIAAQTAKIILNKEETLWSELETIFAEPFDKAIAFSTILVSAKSQLVKVIQESNFSDILMQRLRTATGD